MPDIRNSKVVDIVRELEAFGIDVQVHDPLATPRRRGTNTASNRWTRRHRARRRGHPRGRAPGLPGGGWRCVGPLLKDGGAS